jgi:hypothetical protein
MRMMMNIFMNSPKLPTAKKETNKETKKETKEEVKDN